MPQGLPVGEIIMMQLFPGGAMKSSKTTRVQTTLGELVSALREETEALFDFERNESSGVVAPPE
jgi:hypothetical protein